jgi:hypothetical protein
MVTRRGFLGAGAVAVATGAGCSAGDGHERYLAAAKQVRAPWPESVADGPARVRELVRYSTLAPSSHNTQCWRFRPFGEALASDSAGIEILPDLARRCPVVDPDDHHLFVSLGCAAENLVQAGRARGHHVEAGFDEAIGGVRAVFDPARVERSPLFDAIPLRQTTRSDYDGKPLVADELKTLVRVTSGVGVRLLLLTERDAIERALEYVVAGDTIQLGDPAFVAELEHWIRFSDSEAVATGDGLFSRCSGNPAVPRWLGTRLLRLFLDAKKENDKYAKQIRSSAGIAVFLGEADDRAHWVQVGRAFERFALQATALGIRHAHVNQPVEVPGLRDQFLRSLGVGAARPDLVVRFGRGPEMPPSLRRPVDAVMV